MVMKQHSIRLVGIVVFALCMAANADPNDFVFRAKCKRSRTNTMQRETNDWPDLTPSTSSTSPELLPTRITTLSRASHLLRFQDVAICPAEVVPPIPVWEQFPRIPIPFLHAILPLSVPSVRAPPSL
jgi:hypothetical protein